MACTVKLASIWVYVVLVPPVPLSRGRSHEPGASCLSVWPLPDRFPRNLTTACKNREEREE